jgi:hypothetical protein
MTDLGQAKSDISEIPNQMSAVTAAGACLNPRSDWRNNRHDAKSCETTRLTLLGHRAVTSWMPDGISEYQLQFTRLF